MNDDDTINVKNVSEWKNNFKSFMCLMINEIVSVIFNMSQLLYWSNRNYYCQNLFSYVFVKSN